MYGEIHRSPVPPEEGRSLPPRRGLKRAMENFNDQVQKSLDANWIQRFFILGLRMGLRNILLSCWIKKYMKVEYKDFLVFICKMGLRIFYCLVKKYL
jgi:hypothetical protein